MTNAETTYQNAYHRGKYHRSKNIPMELPNAAENAVGFRGYMDGWGGSDYNIPVPPGLIIDELHKNGMKTIN